MLYRVVVLLTTIRIYHVAVLLITIILYHLVVLLTYLLNDQIENETTCFLQPSKTDRITL